MRGTKASTPWIGPHRLTFIDQAQSSWLMDWVGPKTATPALLMTMWTAPNRSQAASARAFTWARSLTSVLTPMASKPASASPLTAVSSTWVSMSAMTSLAPAAPSCLAMARPMPLAPPVITATLPEKSETPSAIVLVSKLCRVYRILHKFNSLMGRHPGRSVTETRDPGETHSVNPCVPALRGFAAPAGMTRFVSGQSSTDLSRPAGPGPGSCARRGGSPRRRSGAAAPRPRRGPRGWPRSHRGRCRCSRP